MVEAKITAVDDEKHKISLSIRALLNEAKAASRSAAEAEAEEDNSEDALVYEVSAEGEAVGDADVFSNEADE